MKLHKYINKYCIVQKRMAADLGITEGYLSGIINGKRTPSLKLAKDIEEYCNYEVSRLELLYPDEDWPSIAAAMTNHSGQKNPLETQDVMPKHEAKPTAIVSFLKRDQVLDIIRGVK